MNKTLVTLATLLALGLAGSSWAGPDPQAATNAKKAKAAAKAASEPESKKLACGGHGPRDENIQRSKKAKRTDDAKACADAKADAKAAKAAKAAAKAASA